MRERIRERGIYFLLFSLNFFLSFLSFAFSHFRRAFGPNKIARRISTIQAELKGANKQKVIKDAGIPYQTRMKKNNSSNIKSAPSF
jgi:hypothetical protein